MEFNKDHKVDIKTLDKVTAPAFIAFLDFELERHSLALDEARAFIELWQSAEARHLWDIEQIDALIEKVEKEILGE